MCDYQIPAVGLLMQFAVGRGEIAAAIEQRNAVAYYMPFGMTAAAFLQVA